MNAVTLDGIYLSKARIPKSRFFQNIELKKKYGYTFFETRLEVTKEEQSKTNYFEGEQKMVKSYLSNISQIS